MKNSYPISGLLLILLLFPSCKKEEDDRIIDSDGNVYTSVVIGTQTWMIENLKTTHFKNGSEIPLIVGNTTWSNLNSSGFCWYNNDESANKNRYGALYNWFAVNTGNLCPSGWHVPTKDDWDVLTAYLGGASSAGGKLKEMGNTHWLDPNLGATNESGFTALPGGQRDNQGVFSMIGIVGFWWANTPAYSDRAFSQELDYDYSFFFTFNDIKKAGFSVRCIKD